MQKINEILFPQRFFQKDHWNLHLGCRSSAKGWSLQNPNTFHQGSFENHWNDWTGFSLFRVNQLKILCQFIRGLA